MTLLLIHARLFLFFPWMKTMMGFVRFIIAHFKIQIPFWVFGFNKWIFSKRSKSFTTPSTKMADNVEQNFVLQSIRPIKSKQSSIINILHVCWWYRLFVNTEVLAFPFQFFTKPFNTWLEVMNSLSFIILIVLQCGAPVRCLLMPARKPTKDGFE